MASAEWNDLAEVRDMGWAVVNTVMNFWFL
jgi:hypothetical protein